MAHVLCIKELINVLALSPVITLCADQRTVFIQDAELVMKAISCVACHVEFKLHSMKNSAADIDVPFCWGHGCLVMGTQSVCSIVLIYGEKILCALV